MSLYDNGSRILMLNEGIVTTRHDDGIVHHVALTSTELFVASADSFRETGRNLAETAAEDPQMAVDGLMKAIGHKPPTVQIECLLDEYPDSPHSIVVEQDVFSLRSIFSSQAATLRNKFSGQAVEPHFVARIELQ